MLRCALPATPAHLAPQVAHAEAAAGGAAPKYPRANPLQQVAGAVDKVQGAVNTATAVGAAVQSGIDYTQCQLTTGYQVVATSVQEVASWFGKTDVICNHGNWCGAKCSGSGGTAPAVDNLDAACKEHDLCLAGKPSATCGNCDCDGALHKKAQAVSGAGWHAWGAGAQRRMRRRGYAATMPCPCAPTGSNKTDGHLHPPVSPTAQIYDQGKAAKTCKLFNLLCGKTQKSQAAGWVAASQYARRLCNTCPGIKLGVGGLAAGVKTALAVVKPAPIKSLPPCRTATAIADMYSELTEPEQASLPCVHQDGGVALAALRFCVAPNC